MQDIKLIISFDEHYQVCRVTSKGKEYTSVTMDCPSEKLTFGDATKEKVKSFAEALATDTWTAYDGARARTARPESQDSFHQFLNHKLTLIYEDERHLIYQAARKPRRQTTRKAQPEQPEV